MRWFTTTWCLLMAAVLGLPTVNATEAQFASLSERLAEVEAELARYRSGDSCEVPCEEDYTECRTPGLVAGFELALLRARQSEGDALDYDAEATPRIWLGWQGSGGMGFRVRWFEFDATSNNPAISNIDDLNMMTLDLELTDTFTLGSKWEGLFSGGFRFAQYREQYGLGGGGIDYDESYGLVLGVELYRQVTCNWYVFGIARGSVMMTDDSILVGTPSTFADGTFFITELQLGAEYRRVLSGTTYLFGRAAVETDYWSGVSQGDTEDISLMGVAFSVGLAR